ncbi:MAG: hypothetical protein K9M97_10745, partial [Akkermansiaceae bacterium]|nr:hypothetical protein [Akkermansiaceae bacterium]
KSQPIMFVGAAVLLAAAVFGVSRCGRGSGPQDTPLSGDAPPTRHQSDRPSLPDPDRNVIFPGLAPMPFSEKKSMLLKDLAQPYGPFDNLSRDFLDSFENETVQILTDKGGNIAAIKANEHLLPSVSKKAEIPALLEESGAILVRLGTPVANTGNKVFMQALVHAFELRCALRFPNYENGAYIDRPTGPHVIIPVTYIDKRHEDGKPPDPSEKSGLLWMTKRDTLPKDIAGMWHYDIPIEEAILVGWRIIPLNVSGDSKEWWQVMDFDNDIKTPDYVFERKIRQPGDPPDKPIPPATLGPRSGPPPLTEPDPPSTE